MILPDDKGERSTKETPGPMAALNHGEGGHGLAFRIQADEIETETEILFRREIIRPGSLPILHPVHVGTRRVSALIFVADHAEPVILGDISHDRQLRYIATGSGLPGSSCDDLASTIDYFQKSGIQDAHCATLLCEVDACIADTTAELSPLGNPDAPAPRAANPWDH
ncbi:MAG: gamma-glutamylcyclotransferase [Pseudomonadota bacterium]